MKKMKMKLFGKFLLSDGTAVMGEEELRSKKLVRLLVYILLHKDQVLTHQKLIEVFWEDNSRDPEGALRNQMYRIRNELKIFGPETYINTLPGAYQWNPEIQLETDFEQMEELNNRRLGYEKMNEEERKTLCREIIACFAGNITTKIAGEMWMLPLAVRYQTMYMDTVKMLCEILEKENAWMEIEGLCNEALRVDPHDEDIYCWLLRSLHGQNRNDRALQRYNMATKLFYESLGITNPAKLRKVFDQILSDTQTRVTDILELLDDAREDERPNSVFICDYQIFRQIYRMEVRRIDRLGVAEHIALLTINRLVDTTTDKMVDRLLVEGMDILEKTLSSSLRVGDVAARYSPTQFILLLPMCSYESGIKVIERVKDKFQKSIGQRKLSMTYEMAELTASGR